MKRKNESIFSSLKNFSHTIKEKLKTPQAEIIFLILIFCVSFVIRFIGLKFSIPFITNGDEKAIVEPVYNMTKNKTLNSDFFPRPDQILFMLNFIYLNLISFVKTGKDFSLTFMANQYDYYFYSRILIAAFGSLIPVAAFKIGKEGSINYSVPAALIFAFFPVYVLHSHLISPDIPTTFFTLLIILFSIRYIRKTEVKYLYLATIFASINTAEKYPGLISFGLVVFSIFWVQLTNHKDQFWLGIKRSLVESLKFFGLYIFVIYIIAPNIFIQYGKVIASIKGDAIGHQLGAVGLSWFGNMVYYLNNYSSYSNIIFILFMILGLFGIVKLKKFEFLPCLFGLLYWVVMSKLSLHWERWALPMYTFPLLLGAFGVGYFWEIFKEKKVLRSIGIFFFSVSLVWSLLFSLSISIRMTYKNTEVVAFSYCEKAGITKENTAYEYYTPFSPAYDSRTFFYTVANNTKKYTILSSNIYDRAYADPVRNAGIIQRYDEMKKQYTLIKEIAPTSPSSSNLILSWLDDVNYFVQRHLGINLPERFTGPVIQIYEINKVNP